MKIVGPPAYQRSWGQFVVKCVGTNTGAALFVPLITWMLSEHYTARNAWTDFVAASVYSNCIGTPFLVSPPGDLADLFLCACIEVARSAHRDGFDLCCRNSGGRADLPPRSFS